MLLGNIIHMDGPKIINRYIILLNTFDVMGFYMKIKGVEMVHAQHYRVEC